LDDDKAGFVCSSQAPDCFGAPLVELDPTPLRLAAEVDLLIIDDWAMAPMTELERRDFLKICDARYQTRSSLLTSQLPVASWHAQIGDPTIADSILDRLVHNAHRIELQGESMRKKRRGKANGEAS
jgi:DNA replication protein DnaC